MRRTDIHPRDFRTLALSHSRTAPLMLDDLKKVFSRSWDSFLHELSRREPEDRVAELLGAMRREMVDARANLPLLEKEHTTTVAELARERQRLEDTVRRGGLAEKAGDAETVRVAAEFAERHRRRIAVLEEKVRATRAEWELGQQEVADMSKKYKEAEANRFGLLAELRRTGTRTRLDSALGRTGGDPNPTLDDWARAEEKIERDSALTDALEELEGGTPAPRPRPADVDAQLEELKRRMGMG